VLLAPYISSSEVPQQTLCRTAWSYQPRIHELSDDGFRSETKVSSFKTPLWPRRATRDLRELVTVMSKNGQGMLNPNRDENNSPDRVQRLSRSPHPYTRHRFEAFQRYGKPGSLSRSPIRTPPKMTERSSGDGEKTYFDADQRGRRKDTESADDSGTEADDEKGLFLLGLPAPPMRPRKGLKDHRGAESPLLTPSILDDDHRRSALGGLAKRRTSVQSETTTDEETVKLREKFTRKRRAELIRRISETVLLVVVCYLSCKNNLDWFFSEWAKGRSAFHWPRLAFGTSLVLRPLSIHVLAVLGLYVLYPLRIINENHARSVARKRSRFYIHLPAAFDPAPLLYPIFLPVVVALSVQDTILQILLPNLVLSLSSIPSKIIPFGNLPWYSSPQWILSILPVITSQTWNPKEGLVPVKDLQALATGSINVEILVLLFPLHQALLPILESMTTTSLLPAELQLLSVSLVDLLLLPSSPQASILKSLLWIGGVSILTLCGRTLSWAVALARVPSWRFRRPHVQTRRRGGIIVTTNNLLNGRLGSWGLIAVESEDSEDSDEYEMHRSISRRQRKVTMLRINTNNMGKADRFTQIKPSLIAPMSATGDGTDSAFPGTNGTIESQPKLWKHQRRYTLPSNLASPMDLLDNIVSRGSVTHHTHNTKSWSFRSLTASQASWLKWGFAIYVYIIIALLIAGPIRMYVSRSALHNQEPVGWALGYLFGDLPIFRSFAQSHDLHHWVCQPNVTENPLAHVEQDWVELVFHHHLGAANTRLLVCSYCLGIIAVGLVVVFRLSTIAEVDTRRKVFHGMMVAMFLPTIFVDPTFVGLAFILILAIFLLLDLFRASQLPPLSKPLTHFLAPYVDGRDHRGPVIVSHIFLLIGCAIPLWLSLASVPRTGDGPWQGWDVPTRDLSMISGVVCVGMGDAAASLIGRRYGQRRWCWSGGKSLEGSLAFAVAVVLGLSAARTWLLVGGWAGDGGDTWATTLGKAAVAGTGASLTEAVLTGGNDNVIVPIILWLLVRGLGM